MPVSAATARLSRRPVLSRVRLSLLALLLATPVLAADPAPRRVVSMNLCTDQLAMLLAAPGQLVSVSRLAADPRSSAMAQQARSYPQNHGQAEEIWQMRPDLVIAGSYTARATVTLLKRLGVPVLQVQPARSLSDVDKLLRQVGDALGRTAQADTLIADFDTRLAALRAEVRRRPRAAIYQANGYSSGDATLAGEILEAAGFDNVAGPGGGTFLPLEKLVMADPEVLITSVPYPGASRAEEILHHPVVRDIRARSHTTTVLDHDWICGTPHVLEAIAALAETRKALE
ncbi:ABC transporter substrate-binding protein [Pseudooceanicola sp. CBS1P-1]|uniref:ABC transporter substrate-binding protein n=1 Tax=Pseudooceanicola albus TaxID=2692189 RepID=A0A6L7FVW4_9RHOB|nr:MULTISPECIES: ABC transporter substrate-binding protein [Pseudooceanicola]MBT9383434.1 ABC transporter substrate-binding protein [Pseudooceanicola endophyticus]MXN16244.1 ABC transporter substrate-binding protein [Pseudooceanicola albus]